MVPGQEWFAPKAVMAHTPVAEPGSDGSEVESCPVDTAQVHESPFRTGLVEINRR